MKLQEKSRIDFDIPNRFEWQHIQVACLQRIAAACEKMAVKTEDLQWKVDHYRDMLRDSQAERATLERQNRALRGVITKMKRAK